MADNMYFLMTETQSQMFNALLYNMLGWALLVDVGLGFIIAKNFAE